MYVYVSVQKVNCKLQRIRAVCIGLINILKLKIYIVRLNSASWRFVNEFVCITFTAAALVVAVLGRNVVMMV